MAPDIGRRGPNPLEVLLTVSDTNRQKLLVTCRDPMFRTRECQGATRRETGSKGTGPDQCAVCVHITSCPRICCTYCSVPSSARLIAVYSLGNSKYGVSCVKSKWITTCRPFLDSVERRLENTSFKRPDSVVRGRRLTLVVS